MVSVLASNEVDRGFEPWSVQTKDYKIGICCFSAKHAALRRYENASLIIISAETEYISTRYWYRNINFLRDRIRRIFL